MLIRSQDKLQLIPMETGAISINYRNKKEIRFFTAGDTEGNTIATYSTEAKAVKALNMIQAEYEASCYCYHAYDNEAQVQRPYLFVRNAVFQMPQDSEVER